MIVMMGVDYHNMAVGDRELFSLSPEQLPGIYSEIKEVFPQIVFISTCNRMEVYLLGTAETPVSLIDWLVTRFIPETAPPQKVEELKAKFYHHRGSGAVTHLFEVAAGMHSMVVGENQILHQIKRAYTDACSHLSLQAEFHRLFQSALGIGKKVRAQTDIGKGGMSLGSVSVDIIKKFYERNSRFTIALIGAGEIAEEVLKSLLHHGEVKVWLCNRDPDRAQRLLERYREFFVAEYIPFDRRYEVAAAANVTVVSTNAPSYVIDKRGLREALEGRYRFSFFIDLSVPRNIEPAVSELQDLVVYTLDDLDKIISENYSQRSSQINLCQNLIEEQLQEYQGWVRRRRLFLVKREWQELLRSVNQERVANLQSPIPVEKLDVYFDRLYQKLLVSDEEVDHPLELERLDKDFLTRSLERVSLPGVSP